MKNFRLRFVKMSIKKNLKDISNMSDSSRDTFLRALTKIGLSIMALRFLYDVIQSMKEEIESNESFIENHEKIHELEKKLLEIEHEFD